MKGILKNHLGKIFSITVISIISWLINLVLHQYNPYSNCKSLLYPEQYLAQDTLIIKKQYAWSGKPTLDDDVENYSLDGQLLCDSTKVYDLTWYRKDEVPWHLIQETIIDGKKQEFILVFKSKLHDYEVYPQNDQNYINRALYYAVFAVIFFSIPFITIPFFLYLLYLGYLERKHEKTNI